MILVFYVDPDVDRQVPLWICRRSEGTSGRTSQSLHRGSSGTSPIAPGWAVFLILGSGRRFILFCFAPKHAEQPTVELLKCFKHVTNRSTAIQLWYDQHWSSTGRRSGAAGLPTPFAALRSTGETICQPSTGVLALDEDLNMATKTVRRYLQHPSNVSVFTSEAHQRNYQGETALDIAQRKRPATSEVFRYQVTRDCCKGHHLRSASAVARHLHCMTLLRRHDQLIEQQRPKLQCGPHKA